MANIPIPENDDSLELNVRYQPDMVLEGMLDATVPEMKYLRLSQGNETHDLLGAQSGDQILELLSEDLTAADEGKVLTAVYGGIEGEETGSVVWAKADPLPVIGEGDAGKVLTVNAGETGTEWAEPSGGGGGVNAPTITATVSTEYPYPVTILGSDVAAVLNTIPTNIIFIHDDGSNEIRYLLMLAGLAAGYDAAPMYCAIAFGESSELIAELTLTIYPEENIDLSGTEVSSITLEYDATTGNYIYSGTT